jgi:predicted nucleic acid-binding protein
MPDGPPRIYWDACVFLSYINAIPDRMPTLEDLLQQSSQGTIEIITSSISIVEVAWEASEKAKRELSQEIEDRIDTLWSNRETIMVVEYHELIAKDARTLMRNGIPQGWSLKPMDAIHFATAQRLSVSQFHTYDKTIPTYQSLVGFQIREPFVEQGKLFVYG